MRGQDELISLQGNGRLKTFSRATVTGCRLLLPFVKVKPNGVVNLEWENLFCYRH
jgi:hypothetical protein